MSSSRTIQLIVTCTDRKTVPAPKHRQVRTLKGDPVARESAWVDRIKQPATTQVLPARELYAGEHWNVVTSIPDRVGRWTVKIWVASAGLGLIPIEKRIESYGATFANGQADSIARAADRIGASDTKLDWWSGLTKRSRSIASVARANPASPIVFAGSPSYLRPLAEDLTKAVDLLNRPDQLFIASAGKSSVLPDHQLNADARLTHSDFLGGTRLSINVRIAKWLVESAPSHKFDPHSVHAELESFSKNVPKLKIYNRTRVTEKQMRSFITKEFRDARRERRNVAPHSRLLRQFRTAGFAYEQKNFRALYFEVADGMGDVQ
jgi:hypothetical protein